jgi:hypothetical protein
MKRELLIAAFVGMMVAAALSLFPGCQSVENDPGFGLYPIREAIDPVTEENLNVHE